MKTMLSMPFKTRVLLALDMLHNNYGLDVNDLANMYSNTYYEYELLYNILIDAE